MTVNLVIKIEKNLKKEYYTTCNSLGIKPMRATLILIEHFAKGKINALPILEEYKTFRYSDKDRKIIRLLKNRINGDKAFKIHKKKQDADLQRNIHE